MTADLQNPIFTDENAARRQLEAIRWPHGPFCPHCGNADPDKIAQVESKGRRTKDAYAGGKHRPARPGLHYCNECKKTFTVTVGTVFERSKVPLTKWWLATYLLGASKKGMAHQLHRMLGVQYKTAWFMAHRIREATREGGLGPIGGSGKIVEADETYFGHKDDKRLGKRTKRGKRGLAGKRAVLALVERGGHVRTFHLDRATVIDVRDAVVRNVSRESVLFSDESKLYTELGREFDAHRAVRHSAGEYARREGEIVVHTNTVENVFSVLKRGMKGVYQHCGEAHLHRYLAEFAFRHNRRTALGFSDKERVDDIIRGIEGKRLTYRRTDEAAHY